MLLVFQFIEEISADLDDRAKFESKLAQLGQKHENLGIPKQYLEVMGPIFCQIIRPVLMTAAAMSTTSINTTTPSPTAASPVVLVPNISSIDTRRTSVALWGRDSKSAWLRFFRIIAFQMKRGYCGTSQIIDSDNHPVGVLGSDTCAPNTETDPSTGGVNITGSNLQSMGSTDNSQYLLLNHPSTTSEGSHITKKRLARQKMLAISGFTAGFAKSFDIAPGCPMVGQNISGVTGPSTSPYVISDSHAQRKAMFQKQYNQHYKRRVSIDESIGYVR